VRGSRTTYTPETITGQFADVAQVYNSFLGETNKEKRDALQLWCTNGLNQITGVNGCREALVAMLKDKRTVGLLHLGGSGAALHDRMGGGGTGFASADMLDSYLRVTSANYTLNTPDTNDSKDDSKAEFGHEDRVVEFVSKYAIHAAKGMDDLETIIRDKLGSEDGTIRRYIAGIAESMTWIESRGANPTIIETTARRLRAMYARNRNMQMGTAAMTVGVGRSVNPLGGMVDSKYL
jgi:hypothetical protein